MSPIGIDVTTIRPRHFRWDLAGRVATITLNRPERKNPLTFESYGELTETFRSLSYVTDVRAVDRHRRRRELLVRRRRPRDHRSAGSDAASRGERATSSRSRA